MGFTRSVDAPVRGSPCVWITHSEAHSEARQAQDAAPVPSMRLRGALRAVLRWGDTAQSTGPGPQAGSCEGGLAGHPVLRAPVRLEVERDGVTGQVPGYGVLPGASGNLQD